MKRRAYLHIAGLAAILALPLAGCAADTGETGAATAAADAAPAAVASAPAPGESPLVLVAYDSRTGMTERLAAAVAEGARESGRARVVLALIDSVQTPDLVAASAILLGSPTHWANMTTSMRAFIDSWPERGFLGRDRIGGAFATGGGSAGGKEMVLTSLILAMLNHGMIVVGPIFRDGDIEYGNFGVGATTGLMSEQSLTEADLDAARALGRRAVDVLSAIEARGRV